MPSIRRTLIFCAALAAARTQASAQGPGGEQPLVRATASAILGLYRPSLFLIAPPAARFDTLVAVELLAQAPGRLDPDADYALYLGTRGVRMAADTAVVTILLRQHTHATGLNYWEQTDEIRFVPDAGAWRFVQHTVIGHADGGDVRGRRR